MQLAVSCVRVFFVLLSIVFMMSYATTLMPQLPMSWSLFGGGLAGLGFGLALFYFDQTFKRFNLRVFNTILIGLFFGYLMSSALLLIIGNLVDIVPLEYKYLAYIKLLVLLFGTYSGVIMTLKAAEDIHVHIPFVKLQPTSKMSHDLLVDISALCDSRTAELASSGLFDRRLIIPRFLLSDLQLQSDEGKRAMEVLKKLETIPHLHMRFQDTDFSDSKDLSEKMHHLARLLDAQILAADNSRDAPGVRTISLQALTMALKPLKQKGETLKIKIVKPGKEDFQGVGYLSDGTMVVVNGGADYIMQTIDAQVIAAKQTPTGRIIFCNVAEENHERTCTGNWH